MGLACAAYNEAEYKEQFRQMVYDEVDKWVDELLPLFDEDNPTIMHISDVFTETRQGFLGACFQKLIEQKYADLMNQEFSPCPQCGKVCKKRRDHSKQMVTMQGPSSLKRPWFYCVDCSHGFYPLDEAIELSRKKHQFDVQNKAAKISADDTFRKGSEIFQDLTGQSISDHFIHETFEHVGAEAYLEDVVPSQEEIEKRIKHASSDNWRPILVVASDGAHLPTRPKAKRSDKRGKGRWQEAKGFRIYLLDNKRIIHIASWHQIQKEKQFGRDLELVASRIPQDSVRIGLLGDGADWLWKHMTASFPKGRQILDYYHCAEHIYQVAKAQYGEKSIKGLEWVESTICRLFFAEVGYVIGGLRRMQPKNADAKEEIRKLIGYLDNNRKRIHYRGDSIGGYPIGSGGIESANKFICHTRMKRSGAWWVKETGNAMLRIRCAIYNGTYDKVFERYKKANLAKNVIRLLTNR
jgi:hypothetical protein